MISKSYSGIHRKTGRHVAVKLINKMKFPNNKEAALRTEVDILSVRFFFFVHLKFLLCLKNLNLLIPETFNFD